MLDVEEDAGVTALPRLGCKVTSVDISEGPCKVTQKNVPQAEVIKSDLFELQKAVSNRKFDIIWCWESDPSYF